MKRHPFLTIPAFFMLALWVEAQVRAEFTYLYSEREGYLTSFDARLDTN